MWQSNFETTTEVSAEKLFQVITDINRWSVWDDGLEFARIEGEVKAGANFVLKPKGGPLVKLTVDAVERHRLVDTAHLFLGKMRTSHEYVQRGSTTQIRFMIEVWGPLGFLWRKLVGEKQIAEAAQQNHGLIHYARNR